MRAGESVEGNPVTGPMEPKVCSKCGVNVSNMRYDANADMLVFTCQRCGFQFSVPPAKKGKNP